MKKLTKNELIELLSIDVPTISTEQMDEMAIPTYLHHNPLIRWLMWRRYEKIADILRQRAISSGLEFGCGIGLFLPEFAERCRQAYAIDLFPEYAKLLNDRMTLGVIFKNSVDEFEDESLDVIVAADVLEHVDDLQGLLSRFMVKLSGRGTLVISGPTENVAYKIGRFIAGFSGKADYHHVNIDEIIQVAQSVGFKIQQTTRLPFPGLLTLFKITTFVKPEPV